MPAHMREYAYVKRMYLAELVHLAVDEYIEKYPLKTIVQQVKLKDVDKIDL